MAQADIKNYLGKQIALIGYGITGKSILRLLLHLGVSRSNVFVFDEKNSEVSDVQSYAELIQKKVDLAVVSPGVPLASAGIQLLKAQNCHLTSELEIAFNYIEAEKLICITGSLGKSTTTALLGYALGAVDPHVFCGGNLGVPLADYIYDVLTKSKKRARFVVLELSSYQLELFRNLRTDISIFTYLAANHLERYKDLEHYYHAKWILAEQTKHLLLFNSAGGDLKSFVERQKLTSGIRTQWTNGQDSLMNKYAVTHLQMVGAHNRDNFALVLHVLEFFGITKDCLERAISFPGLPHRLEKVYEDNDVHAINDSKATTIESVLQAVSSVAMEPSCKRILLLLGGRDKSLPWEKLNTLSTNSNILFFFFGECGELAQHKSNLSGPLFHNLRDCTKRAIDQSQSGDYILLSPGGSSLDEFKNFEERGNYFKSLFKKSQ